MGFRQVEIQQVMDYWNIKHPVSRFDVTGSAVPVA